MTFTCTKSYDHNLGLSVCFRQWRAKSHCSYLHGYPLAFDFTFSCSELDENGWVINYGGLKPIKKWLEEHFDHKFLIARDDPYLEALMQLNESRIADVIVVEATGTEAFAKMAFQAAERFLYEHNHTPRVRLQKVRVREHGANSATYEPDNGR